MNYILKRILTSIALIIIIYLSLNSVYILFITLLFISFNAISELINQVAYTRNQFLGITKGFEIKHFQLTNIIKLRVAGMEDAEINNRH